MKSVNLIERKKHGTPDFPCALYMVEPMHPEYILNAHWHREYEICWVHEGILHTTIDSYKLDAGPNDLVFIPSGALHVNYPENCIYDCFVFDFNMLLGCTEKTDKYLSPISNNTVRVSYLIQGEDFELNKLFYALRRTMIERPYAYELSVVSALLNLFSVLLKEHRTAAVSPKTVQENLALERLKQVFSYIDEHIGSTITLNEMADVASLSPKYFCEYFRIATGMSPIKYVNNKKISVARQLLARPGCSVTEAALSVGFSDTSYFIKLFRQTTGVSPKTYSKSFQ